MMYKFLYNLNVNNQRGVIDDGGGWRLLVDYVDEVLHFVNCKVSVKFWAQRGEK